MAVPRQMISLPKAQGIVGIQNKIVNLQPSNLQAEYIEGNRVVFNVPAYANGAWLNPTRSFFNFGITAKTANDEKMADGIPIIERMVVKAGNGMLLEDIQGYSEISRILSNFESPTQIESDAVTTGDYRASSLTDAGKAAILVEQKTEGVVYRHKLRSGIFGGDFFLPINMFSASGGYAFTIEFELASNAKVCPGASASTYGVVEPNLQLELVELGADVTARFNAELLEGKVTLPYSTFRQHKDYIAANTTNKTLSISDAVKNASAVYTVMRTDSQTLDFDDGVTQYQLRYGTSMYPQVPVKMPSANKTKALLNAMAALDLQEKPVFCGTVGTDGGSAWKKDFAIVVGFKTSRDDVYNGLNTSASAQPLIMDLVVATDAAQREVLSYVKEDLVLSISAGGSVSLSM